MRLFLEDILIGFEFKNFIFAVAVIFIAYIAWESTYVRDYRLQPDAFLIIDNEQRLLVGVDEDREDLRPTTDWEQETSDSDSGTNNQNTGDTPETTGAEQTVSNISRENTVQIPEPPPSLEVVIEEVHDLANAERHMNENVYRTLESLEEGITALLEENETGPESVIRAMDTTEGIRRRRLAFYGQDQLTSEEGVAATVTAESNSDQGGGDSNNANTISSSRQPEVVKRRDENVDATEKTKTEQPEAKKEEIRIKLKFLNDDMKLVRGSPSENIGEFKKRNFTLEMSSHKFVRLVFNGQVLQPDSKTLQACGLFDNCVVHCLVHNRNPPIPTQTHQSSQTHWDSGDSETDGDGNPANGNEAFGSNMGPHDSTASHLMAMYAGIGFVTLSLVLCWYCRIQYHVFFSWYSTLVLILVTILFSILGPLLVFIEHYETRLAT